MSDIVQGALIGIGGAIVGAIITAAIAYINTKSQINLRIYELRTDSLIKAREKVLIPLREAMTQSLELANKALIMMIRMDGAYKRKEDPKEIREEIQRWEEASRKSSEASAKFEILRNQVSDAQLYQMIEDVKNEEEEQNPKIIEAVMRVQDTKNLNMETLRATLKDLAEARRRIFDKLLPVNKRIEELLSGE
ncbi:MAG: hypothetical protein OEZ00_05680 [Dehalococcoidia bacterium]|nr:hypothetical protein [Dehalococcoidia bacterium]